jgi:hypothetical protein
MHSMRNLMTVVAMLLLGVAGCGGSGGGRVIGQPPDPTDPPPDPTDPPGNVTVSITARDVFGVPVPGGEIMLLISSGQGIVNVSTPTDANGRAELLGNYENVYAAFVSATDLEGNSYEPSRPADDRIEFDVTLHPWSALVPGVSRVSVTGSSADGRQLEFSARLHVVEHYAVENLTLADWNFGAVSVMSCVPAAGADCVEGPAGFDAFYEGVTLTQSWVEPVAGSEPLAVALLLDQGSSVAVTDPADRRLLAARYFQTRLNAGDQVLLAAFAADDSSTGDVALLPNQPATIFPVDDPAFTTDGRVYFPTIDALATLEGGASPLHAAAGELIGFAASAAPADARRAVVVLASGATTDCDMPADCHAAQEALREQSESTDVAVVAVGLSDRTGQADRAKLGPLAQSEQGAVFWAQDATQVPTVFGRLSEIIGDRHGAIDVTIRLESTVAGAFASGHTVLGTLHIPVCPWDCTESVDVPFALRVP